VRRDELSADLRLAAKEQWPSEKRRIIVTLKPFSCLGGRLPTAMLRWLNDDNECVGEALLIGGSGPFMESAMSKSRDTEKAAEPSDEPPRLAGTHYDDQAERLSTRAPEDFPRDTGIGGHVRPDRPPLDELSTDPELNILPSDSPGG
jgi:hypothetical protein